MIKLSIVWALAALFTANSLLITIRANFNAGTLIMWGISICLIVYGIFYKHIDKFCLSGVGKIIKIIFFCGMSVFVLLFLFVAISGYTDQAKGDEKAIIVLGAGLRGENVSNILHRRLTAALEEYEKNPSALIVVTGGQGESEVIPEALAMQRWLVAKGVSPEKIIIEDKSVSTEENLLFAQNLLKERGIGKDQPVAVVSNAFHCYRAEKYAEKVGFTSVSTVPATINITTILPSYCREVLAILYMWVFKN